LQIWDDGNIGVNTSTNAGFKLDARGTTRVGPNAPTETNAGFIASSGNHFLYIKSISSTSGEIGFRRGTASGSEDGDYKFLFDNASAFINYNRPAQVLSTSCQFHLSYVTAGSERGRWTNTGNYLINTTTDAGFKLDVNGTARVQGNLTISASGQILMNNNNIYVGRGAGSGTDGIEIRALSSGTDAVKVTSSSLIINQSGALTYQASAILQAESTTKGFLPPRMTTTQKNAIASPATGLMVYDTTLNRPCFYDGTTWITL
jgi:hypothetical protein